MEDKQLTLVEHLGELRKRIIIIIIALIVGAIVSYKYIDLITEYMLIPAKKLDFIYLSPPELFIAYVKISLICGAVISSPINLIQIWLFIRPGLKKSERKHLLFALYMGIIFFSMGVAFAYYIITPITIEFFINMSVNEIEPLFSIQNYLSFILSLLISFGLVFELPMLVILLTKLNLVTSKSLKKHRKIVLLIIFIAAAVLTPPDIISQVLLGIPMFLLYEFSIWISAIIGKRKEKKKSQEE